MPFLRGVEVSAEETDEAVVTASATGDPRDDLAPLEPLNNITLGLSQGDQGAVCPPKR